MGSRLRERRSIREEVVTFTTEPKRYAAETITGRRVNIVRSRSHQPPILQDGDFKTYLWVEALTGFFLFSQRFQEGRAGPWILEEEFVPENPEHFFFDFFDEHVSKLE